MIGLNDRHFFFEKLILVRINMGSFNDSIPEVCGKFIQIDHNGWLPVSLVPVSMHLSLFKTETVDEDRNQLEGITIPF